MTTTANTAYIPGMCNINRTEINKRQKLGYIGLTVFILGLIMLTLLTDVRWVRIILILPAILSVSGFLQARNKFCVGYAGAGMQNAGEGSAEASKITNAAALAADKHKSSKMNRQTLLIAVVVTALTLLIPVIR
jgi:hypothetical protein